MDFGTNKYELYNLDADPSEYWELTIISQQTVHELKAEFDQFKTTIKQR